TTHDGKFIYPTYRGFLFFNPKDIQRKESHSTKVYASEFKVFNVSYPLEVNIEDVEIIKLQPDQNLFSIELTALNYEDPDKVFYAYKLSPLNKEWIYTKERNVTYANLSGDNYTFFYKATIDPSDWNVPVNQLNITVATVFYKKTWFILSMILLISALIYRIYSYRLNQTRNVHKLQLQATMLERDKTEIQYQNLINQFNPHFLFNSLTSLNSLIYENKELASDFLEQLSAVYRYLLTNKDNQLVTLEAEINFVHHYISLLKTRFENRLNISINIPHGLLQKKIVPITFQIMIENALKHNVVDEGSPLFISFTADEKYLYVINNVQKKAFVETSNRKGLESLQSLYKYLSASPLVIAHTETTFEIRVPLL
ncbi:MAG: histidine kinase, partial [Saprospiraceae bacterium]|nr:histidine kinase [Saprospiraceae bacterium]